MLYRVFWEIDIDANSHKDAAELALIIQRDPESTATVFDVQAEDDNEAIKIDLEEDEGEEE